MAVAKTLKLNTGVEIPTLGLGTYLSESDVGIKAVVIGLQSGYKLIDTAEFYENEAEVGKGMKASGLAREDMFITTKLSKSDTWAYGSAVEAIKERLRLLDTPYIDLLLLHAPGNGNTAGRAGAWKAMEEAHKRGELKAIGVSNFGPHHIEKLLETAAVTPAVNQVEIHPFLQRSDLVAWCRSKGIVVEAYSPLCKGRSDMNHPTITAVAKKLGVTNAQVLIRWSLQKGLVTLPKSSDPERIKQNADVWGFELDADALAQLDGLESGKIIAWDPITTHAV